MGLACTNVGNEQNVGLIVKKTFRLARRSCLNQLIVLQRLDIY